MEPMPHKVPCLKIYSFKDFLIKRQAFLGFNKNKSVFSLINHQKCSANNVDQAEGEGKPGWKENSSVMEGREGTINSVWDKRVCTGLYS